MGVSHRPFKAHTLCETFKRTLVAVLHTDCRVAEFMNNHLGNISLKRRDNKGAVATVELPAWKDWS